jgi:hypothetical protein
MSKFTPKVPAFDRFLPFAEQLAAMVNSIAAARAALLEHFPIA